MLSNDRKIIPGLFSTEHLRQNEQKVNHYQVSGSHFGHNNGEGNGNLLNLYLTQFLADHGQFMGDYGFTMTINVELINKAITKIVMLYNEMHKNQEVSFIDLADTKQLLSDFIILVERYLEINSKIDCLESVEVMAIIIKIESIYDIQFVIDDMCDTQNIGQNLVQNNGYIPEPTRYLPLKRDREQYAYGMIPSGFKVKKVPVEFYNLFGVYTEVNHINYLEILPFLHGSLRTLSKIEHAEELEKWITKNLNPSKFSLNDADRKNAYKLFIEIKQLFGSEIDDWVDILLPKTENRALQDNDKRTIIKKLTYGRLDVVYVSGLICNILMENFKQSSSNYLLNTFIYKQKQNDKTIEIKKWVIGKEDINIAIANYKHANNKLTLIPYKVTDRGLFQEDHVVLVAIYKKKLFVIDPKSPSSSQIDNKQLTNLGLSLEKFSPGWQWFWDSNNCGRYTAYMAIQLAMTFMSNSIETFKLEEFIMEMKSKSPNIEQLQLIYADYLKKFCF